MERKRKGSVRRFFRRLFVFLLLLLLAAAGVAVYTVARQRVSIGRLGERVEHLTSGTTPLRFMVLSRSDQSVSARFRFYTADGQEIASFERSWNGWELAIDTVIVPVGDRFLAFPSRVFTDAVAPKRGTALFPYYDRSGFPAIYESANLSSEDRKALSELFSQVRGWDQTPADAAVEDPGNIGNALVKGIFGNAVHDVKRLRGFEVGTVYDLVVRPTGAIEIIQE